ncbi:TolC family protein [Flavobacterium sp. MAH-1]|uniref:TolC family protein n=1 Tax=Flavobacterium agri TaxID=2743471 RepID=A0A7Y8Y415_9FLAO|nr:TolC family protein [Flavobacterium agri]NUY81479.1 TolC family protein [Flavobacterium agri]NYA71503.1 TolC family protein [Flavobacterium agri]
MSKLQNLMFLLLLTAVSGSAQILTMPEAIQTGVANYGTVKAKENYAKASGETVKQTRRDYLPNLVLSGQQDYGTVNGQNGPLYGYGGYGVASSGIPLDHQNWNAAFGALYLANVNWEFFTFGRYRERINLAKADLARNQADYQQELFQHQIRVAAAYLNLLASQRLVRSQQKNLDRAKVFLNTSGARVKNGLNPGVDSTLASAEVSRAKIELNRVLDLVKEQNNRLAFLMGTDVRDFQLDTSLVTKIPNNVLALQTSADSVNPILKYYKSRLDFSDQQVKLYRKNYYPSFSLFGVFQTRASGFEPEYTQDQTQFSRNYFDGISPDRQNYLVGVGVTWNLTNILRTSKQVSAQKFVSEGLKNEYDVIDKQLKTQSDAADAKIRYAMDNYNESPRQVAAAKQAYLQRTTLYKNGLTTLTDVTQALYILNRAETDNDVIFTNVWQSLLLKSAATGDFNLFLTEFQ